MQRFTIFLIIIYCSEIWSFQCYTCPKDSDDHGVCQSPEKTNCADNINACYSMRFSRHHQEKGCVGHNNFSNELCKKMNRRPRLGVPFNAYCLRCQSENCNICNNNDVCTKEELDKINKPYYGQKDNPSPNRRMSCYECSGAGDYCEYEFGTSQVVTCYEGECFIMQNETLFIQGCVTERMFLEFPSYCQKLDEQKTGYCKMCSKTQNCNQRFELDPKYDPKKFKLQYTKNKTDDDNKLKCYNCTKTACETQHFAIEVCEASIRECYIMYQNNIPYKMGCNTKGLTLEKCRDTVKHQYCNMCKKDYCNSSILIMANFNLIILFLFLFSLLKI